MSPELMAITVRLPWAAAIAAGEKLVENRGRPIPQKYIGERVAIHAGASWSPEGAKDWRVRSWWYGHTAARSLSRTDLSHLFGKVLAVATLTDCHRAVPDYTACPVGACCEPWGDAFYGGPTRTNAKSAAYHLVFADVVALDELVVTRGYLSVPFVLPDDVAAQVLAVEAVSR